MGLTALGREAEADTPALNSGTGTAVPEPARYRIELPAGQTRFTLHYQGRIRHGLQQAGAEYARGFRETAGTISVQGVFLAGQSLWYPHITDELMSFDLSLRLPQGWYGMSQGERVAREAGTDHVTEQWRCSSPQQEIYLIAGRFSVRALMCLRPRFRWKPRRWSIVIQ